MIFSHTLEQVLTGQKTETRRIRKPGEIFRYVTVWPDTGETGVYKVLRSFKSDAEAVLMDQVRPRRTDHDHTIYPGSGYRLKWLAYSDDILDRWKYRHTLYHSPPPLRTYAIQPGRGQRAIGRILLRDIRTEDLQEIDMESAMREGCPKDLLRDGTYRDPRDWFLETWDQIHPPGQRSGDNPRVWVLRFELAELYPEAARYAEIERDLPVEML